MLTARLLCRGENRGINFFVLLCRIFAILFTQKGFLLLPPRYRERPLFFMAIAELNCVGSCSFFVEIQMTELDGSLGVFTFVTIGTLGCSRGQRFVGCQHFGGGSEEM
jgi:hypothetical protein